MILFSIAVSFLYIWKAGSKRAGSVNRKIDSIQESSFRTACINDRCGDLLRCTKSAHRLTGNIAVICRFWVGLRVDALLERRRKHRSRADTVNTHTVFQIIGSHSAGERQNCALRGGISRTRCKDVYKRQVPSSGWQYRFLH